MLTFNQLEPSFHKWAKHFRCNNFEHWELINAVWLKGGVQKLEHIEFASSCIKYDMIDYMRSESLLRTKTRHRLSGRFYPETISLSEPTIDDRILQDLLESKTYLDDIDTKDLFNKLLKGFSRTAKLIIRLKCAGFTFVEIDKVVGMSNGSIWNIYHNALIRIRQKLIDMGLNVRKCSRKFESGRDIDSVSRYNRSYYEVHKVRRQAQRKKAKIA